MNTIFHEELEQIVGGGDSFATDAGQFAGGMVGWFRANPLLAAILGPGIGGAMAIAAGLNEANR